jgi:hypothetical protein
MTRINSIRRAFVVAAALAAFPPIARAQDNPQQQAHAERVAIADVASQLGVKVSPQQTDELRLGGSVTGSLTDPKKLAALGIGSMHNGARVTFALIAPDKVRVEADEMEPVEARGAVTLRIDAKGVLSQIPK